MGLNQSQEIMLQVQPRESALANQHLEKKSQEPQQLVDQCGPLRQVRPHE